MNINGWEKIRYVLDCVYIAIYTIKCVKSAHFKLAIPGFLSRIQGILSVSPSSLVYSLYSFSRTTVSFHFSLCPHLKFNFYDPDLCNSQEFF